MSCQVLPGLLSTHCMPGTGVGLYLDQGSPCPRAKDGFLHSLVFFFFFFFNKRTTYEKWMKFKF